MPLILEVSICGGGAFLTGAATGLTGSASATGAGGGVVVCGVGGISLTGGAVTSGCVIA